MGNWKQRVYDSYISNGFGDAHSLKKEFDISNRYFKKNYLRFMPNDKEKKILELGCGMGQFYYFCKQNRYFNYEGIDVSKENIDFIKENIDSSAKVAVIDIMEYLEKAGEEIVDVVIFNDVIEHLTKEEIITTLDGIHKVLKKNGIVMIKTPNMANPYVNTSGRYIDITHEVGFTETSMKQVLRATRFTDIVILGTDIYVLNPIISILAKVFSKIKNSIMYFNSVLYGRTSLKIYEKDILAIARK